MRSSRSWGSSLSACGITLLLAAIVGAVSVDEAPRCAQEKSLIKDLLSNLAREEGAAASERNSAATRATAMGINVGDTDSQETDPLRSLLAPRGPAQSRENPI